MWLLIFLDIGEVTIPGLSSLNINDDLSGTLKVGVYAIAITLAEMQLFYQYFNTYFNKQWLVHAGAAAYTVYVIHMWFLNIFIVIYIEILRAAGVPIEFADQPYSLAFYTRDAAGQPAVLSNSAIWGGFFFVFVLAQLFVWPFAHYFRKLPVLN